MCEIFLNFAHTKLYWPLQAFAFLSAMHKNAKFRKVSICTTMPRSASKSAHLCRMLCILTSERMRKCVRMVENDQNHCKMKICLQNLQNYAQSYIMTDNYKEWCETIWNFASAFAKLCGNLHPHSQVWMFQCWYSHLHLHRQVQTSALSVSANFESDFALVWC